VDNKKKGQDILDGEYDDFLNEKIKSKGVRLPPPQQQSKRPPRGKKVDNEPKGVIIERAVFVAEEAVASGSRSRSGSASPPRTRKGKSKKSKTAEAGITETLEEGQSSRKHDEEDILMEEEPKEEEAPLIIKRKRRAPQVVVSTPPKKLRTSMRGEIKQSPTLLQGVGSEVHRELQHNVPLPTIVKFKTELTK